MRIPTTIVSSYLTREVSNSLSLYCLGNRLSEVSCLPRLLRTPELSPRVIYHWSFVEPGSILQIRVPRPQTLPLAQRIRVSPLVADGIPYERPRGYYRNPPPGARRLSRSSFVRI